MSNDGLNSNEDKSKNIQNETPTSRSPVLFVAIIGVLIISLIIGFQAFGILFSIVFPPSPPLPDDVIEVRHDNIDYGVDDWLYRTSMNACDVARYYEQQGGECRFTPHVCGGEDESVTFGSATQQVAACSGEVSFNIFAYRWEANIATGYQFEDGETQFNILREVFWTGSVPPRLDPRKGLEFNN